MSENPAVAVAKEQIIKEENVFRLVSGVRVKLSPVSVALISDVAGRIEDPPIPMFFNKDMDREEENPSDPAYLKAVEETERKRGIAFIDAIALFGIELPDGLPPDETWLPKLRQMEKMDMLNLDAYDMDDKLEKEFVYKRYIVASNDVIQKIQRLSAIQPEEVAEAVKSFPGNA
jgi:hypothetical protein